MNSIRDTTIATLNVALEALKATLPANTEVVLHDLTQPQSSVVGIVNGHVSGRQLRGAAQRAGRR